PKQRRATSRKAGAHWLDPSLPFRPASRRTEQAGRLYYQQTIFQTRCEKLWKTRSDSEMERQGARRASLRLRAFALSSDSSVPAFLLLHQIGDGVLHLVQVNV